MQDTHSLTVSINCANKESCMQKITESMKQRIKSCKKYFRKRVNAAHIINYLNGFIAVGVFIESQDHGNSKGVNDIWIYSCGHNRNHCRIIENTNVEMTIEEAEDLLKCLSIVLERKNEVIKEGT
jgi:hypothetical protein